MEHIGPKRFRLIFRGKLEPDTDSDAARAWFSAAFGARDELLERCFSGRKVALKSKLSEKEAFALQARCQEQGLIVMIEPMAVEPLRLATENDDAEPESPEAGPDADTPRAEPASTPESARHGANHHCIACNRPVRANALHCPWCGARQQPYGRAWPWLAVLAAIVMLLLPLSLLLLPQWRDHKARDQVADAVIQGKDVTRQIDGFIQRTHFWPNSNLDAGLAPPGQLARGPLETIEVGEHARVILTFRASLPEIGGKTLVFLPESDDGKIRWQCSAGTVPARFRPAECAPQDTPREPQSPNPPDTSRSGSPHAVQNGGNRDHFVLNVVRDELKQDTYILQRMATFRRQHGRWPRDHAELALPNPERLGSSAVRKVEVKKEGQVLLVFNSAVPELEDQRLTLVPDAMQRWHCSSSMPAAWLPDSCAKGLH